VSALGAMGATKSQLLPLL